MMEPQNQSNDTLSSGSLTKHEYSQSTVHLISFNAWALPIWLPGHDHSRRFREIPHRLINTGADIICIQETFARRFRSEILSAISEPYHCHSDLLCNRTFGGIGKIDCHGGLITLSKFPIVDEQFFAFPTQPKMRYEEKLGAKGFLLTQILMNQVSTYVINTHLYAGLNQDDEKHRMDQITFVRQKLEELGILSQDIFLMGDLNVLHPSIAKDRSQSPSPVYEYITQEMGFVDSAPIVTKEHHTVDRGKNRYSSNKNGSQKLDYCLYRAGPQSTYKLKYNELLFAGADCISDHMAWSSTYGLSLHNMDEHQVS